MRHVVVVIMLTACFGSIAHAQWGVITDPGINFDTPTPHSLDWIRAHHVRSEGLATIKNGTIGDTTWYHEFAYSGDTIIETTNPGGGGRNATIQKYDGRDTLRYEETRSEMLTRIILLDSLGRKLSEEVRVNKDSKWPTDEKSGIDRWQYRDDGHSVRIENNYYITTSYYDAAKRIDSVIECFKWKRSKGKRPRSGVDTLDVVYYSYGNDNRLHVKRSMRNGAHDVDSIFYYPNEVISREASYQICDVGGHSVGSIPTCLCREEMFDTHGNCTRSIDIASKYAGCGEDLDTISRAYEYDSRGRLIVEISADILIHSEYGWGDDDRPIEVKSYDERGELHSRAAYIIEF